MLIASFLLSQRMRVSILAGLILTSIVLQLIGPWLLGSFVDAAEAQQPIVTLFRLSLAFILATLTLQIILVLSTRVASQTSWTAMNSLRNNVVSHCLNLELEFYKDRTPSEMLERVDGDIKGLANFFSRFALELVGNALLLVSVLILLFLTDWRIGISTTVVTAVAFAFLLGVHATARGAWVEFRESRASFFGFLGEALHGAEDTRSVGGLAYIFKRYSELIELLWPPQRRATVAFALTLAAPLLVFGFAEAVTLVILAQLHSTGAITIGTAFTVFFYIALLTRPIEQIRAQVQSLHQADASIVRIQELLSVPPWRDESKNSPLYPGPLEVRFDRVSFAYGPQDAYTIDNVSFHLGCGKKLGLIGHSGSGKTTLSRLMFRFMNVNKGAIFLGGIQIEQVSRRELRRSVGLVTQDVQIIRASLRDNLTFFDPTITDESLSSALEALGLTEWVEELEDGINTPLSRTNLSSGEAQLVALTRLLLKNPGLVVLDEPSSKLDRATEARVNRALARALAGRTALIIAHRIETVRQVDQILILDHGQVLEQGERRQLELNPDSHFARLLGHGSEVLLS